MSQVLHGLLKPKLILWMDVRFLLLALVLFVLGAFSWLLWLACGAVVLIGLAMGKISPYYVDDLAAYMRWRLFAWDGMIDDEGHLAMPDKKMIARVRRVTS